MLNYWKHQKNFCKKIILFEKKYCTISLNYYTKYFKVMFFIIYYKSKKIFDKKTKVLIYDNLDNLINDLSRSCCFLNESRTSKCSQGCCWNRTTWQLVTRFRSIMGIWTSCRNRKRSNLKEWVCFNSKKIRNRCSSYFRKNSWSKWW